ncbi:MAG: insulinase family protein [Flavobacteriaceae bacterium]|jgi:predicted Zn-dependent peptidase|nr:insulinase family protein [Flavobacteriaceae bacterium]
MKKTILNLVVIFSSTMTINAQVHKTEFYTDSNGYVYESVTNDTSKSRIYTLKNGLKVYLSQNDDEPRIQTYIPVRTGSANDPSDNTGLAHYLEHMMFKGTSKIGTLNWEEEAKLLAQISELYEQHKKEKNPEKKKEIYRKIDKISQEASKYAIANEYDKLISELGASGTNAHTWLDETVYKNNIPSNELERWLFVEKERFSELVLRLFHTELEAVYEEFNRAQDTDGRLVNYELMDALFPAHPYGQQTTLGKSEHLKNPSMEAIHKYYETYYVPNNMAVILVGDLDFDYTIRLVDSYFGNFQYKELPAAKKIVEKPLTSVVRRVVKSPSSERLQIAFRTKGAGTKEALYVKMVDMILNNSGAGLIDININQKQKAQEAGSGASFFTEYGMHVLYGTPKEGQTLEQVEQLLLEQLEEIKKGNFDNWLIKSIVTNLKTQRIKRWDTADGVATQMYNAFIQEQSWQSVLNQFNELNKITKKDIIKFANDFYKDNYVTVYKEKGVNDKLVRVDNPKITPIVLNRTDQSEFYKKFSQLPEKDIQPQFIDYKSLIKTETIENTSFSYIKNKNNELGELYYIFDFGSDNNKELALALNYLELLGTDKYSKSKLEQEFYRLGVDYHIGVQNDLIYFRLQGIEKNLPEGIALLEHLLTHPNANSEIYQNYVQTILKARKNSKLNKQSILNALVQYARFGENNRIRNAISETDLLNKKPLELIDLIKELPNYKHEIFYYGSNKSAIQKAILKYHNFGQGKEYPFPVPYKEQVSEGSLYFAPYDMVQAEILFQSRGEKFNVSKIPLARVFGVYFGRGLSSIVFQEIRESKSLAYSAYAAYSVAEEKDKYDFISSYIGTQANKLPQAVDAMNELMNNMPEIEKQFENARKGALKQIASNRITKANIYWSYLAAKKRDLDYDVRKDIYTKIRTLQLSDLRDFFTKEIKGKKYNVALIGKKESLDWNAVKKLGKVKELTLDELFNY